MVSIEEEDIAFGLFARVLHHHVPAWRSAATAELFGFVGLQARLARQGVLGARQAGLLGLQNEGVPLVEVDTLRRGQGVAGAGANGALKHVVIVPDVSAGRVG